MEVTSRRTATTTFIRMIPHSTTYDEKKIPGTVSTSSPSLSPLQNVKRLVRDSEGQVAHECVCAQGRPFAPGCLSPVIHGRDLHHCEERGKEATETRGIPVCEVRSGYRLLVGPAVHRMVVEFGGYPQFGKKLDA